MENYSLGTIIPSNNTDDGKSSKPKDCVDDTLSPNLKNMGHHSYVKGTTSSCVSSKQLYRHLCGISMYDVFKYSYDEYTS